MNIFGQTGLYIKSITITGENAEDFEVTEGELLNEVLLKADATYNFTLDFIGESLSSENQSHYLRISFQMAHSIG